MTTKHHPEPWISEGGLIHDASGKCFADIADRDGFMDEQQLATEARIVACVNACAGINPEAVPDLLAALEPFADLLEYPEEATANEDGVIQLWVSLGDIKSARAAIAKAKGE